MNDSTSSQVRISAWAAAHGIAQGFSQGLGQKVRSLQIHLAEVFHHEDSLVK
jgi:hypothetical protein